MGEFSPSYQMVKNFELDRETFGQGVGVKKTFIWSMIWSWMIDESL